MADILMYGKKKVMFDSWYLGGLICLFVLIKEYDAILYK